jgi:hypothetical protein
MVYQDVHFETIRKFDTFTDGSWMYLTNNDDYASVPEYCNDPMHGILSANNNSTGAFGLNDWGNPDLLLFGDKGDSETPDPDSWPWWYVSDVSSGVTGGIGGDYNDSRIYFVFNMSPLETEPTGWVGLGAAENHDGMYYCGYWMVSTGMDWTGNGLVDDSNPRIMALAADDDTGLTIKSTDQVATYWVLDSAGIVQGHILSTQLGVDDILFPEDRLDSEEYGDARPIDLAMVPSRAFGYQTIGYNWLAALLDNQDGTWSVGIWEFNYEYGEPDEEGYFQEIAITDPVVGIPQSLDVDCHDFEIHVLYLNQSDQYAVDVLSYNP